MRVAYIAAVIGYIYIDKMLYFSYDNDGIQKRNNLLFLFCILLFQHGLLNNLFNL